MLALRRDLEEAERRQENFERRERETLGFQSEHSPFQGSEASSSKC